MDARTIAAGLLHDTIEDAGVKPKVMEDEFGSEVLTLVQGVTQATARDLMMPAMLHLDEKGYDALLMVHDEGLCENDPKLGSVDEFVKIMCQRPSWGDEDLIIDAKGWDGLRYKK